MQTNQCACAPVREKMPLYTKMHLFSYRYKMALPRSSALQKDHAHCPHFRLQAMQRGGARAEPCAARAPQAHCGLLAAPLPWRKRALWLCEPAAAAPPGPALLSTSISGMRAASRPSCELAAGSFAGMPAGRIEAQRGGCPLARPCMHYRCIRPSRLASRQGGLHSRVG